MVYMYEIVVKNYYLLKRFLEENKYLYPRMYGGRIVRVEVMRYPHMNGAYDVETGLRWWIYARVYFDKRPAYHDVSIDKVFNRFPGLFEKLILHGVLDVAQRWFRNKVENA